MRPDNARIRLQTEREMLSGNQSTSIARGLAALAAIVTVCALALQLGLRVDRTTAEGGTIPQAIWRFLGFFTTLANAAAATVAVAMALRPASSTAGPRTRMTVMSSLVVVGVVQILLLRPTQNSTGWMIVTDHLLHDVTPPLFILAWLWASHGGLKWHHAGWAVVPPLLYAVYALTRGAFDGWYAYWFLDPTALTIGEFVANVIAILAGFVSVALVFVLIDWWIARWGAAPPNQHL